MPFEHRTLVLPDGTRFYEHHIAVQGDAVVADRAAMEFGVETPGRAFLGEGVRVLGNVQAQGDIHADIFSFIQGDVHSDASVYLGERSHIKGKLSVAQDLDVGDDVKIEQGFEARGWINIRSPIPTVVYMFLYLMQMLNAGRSEEVNKVLHELSRTEEMFRVSETFLYVPTGSYLGLDKSTAKGGLRVGQACRVLGNFTVEGDATIGAQTAFHGALRAEGAVAIDEGSELHGDLTAGGHVEIGPRVRVHGAVTADTVRIGLGASVAGTVTAPGGVQFVTPADATAEEKADRFNEGKNPDLVQMLD